MKGWINKENKWPMGKILFTSMILLLVLTMLLVNIVAVQLEKRFSLVGDLTANAAYKVGPETSAVLQSLPKDVHIYVLAEETSFTGEAYLVQANLMMFYYERNLEGNVMIVSSRAEEVLTSAILRVMSDDKIHVAVLKGNGVANKSDFNDLLNENGFVLEDVNMVTDPLDDRYDIAMLLAPQIDLSEAMISKIDEFLYNDGAYGKMLIYTADVTQDILPMTEAYLKEWGIQIGDGAVFETKAERTYQSQPFYPVVDYEDAYYSDLLIDSSVPIIMPLSRPIEALFTVRDKHFTKNLLIFGATSGVRPSDTIDFNVDEGVSWGGNPGLVLASIKIASTDGTAYKQSDILVSASSEMLEAFTIGNTSLGNSEYIIKLLKDSFGKEQSVAIVPKSLAGDILTMNTRQKNIIAWTMVGVIPICILVTGIAVFAMRRYK
jgi:ABC-2 type transport system permease protein